MRESRAAPLWGALAGLVLLAAPASADALLPRDDPASLFDPTPNAPNAIRGQYSTRILDDLSGFELRVDLAIHEVDLPPTGGHSAAELRATVGPLRDLFEQNVSDAILAEAKRVLPEARLLLKEIRFDYKATDLDPDPYHPGLGVHATVEALFTPQFFGLSPSLGTPPAEIARAFLYSGGVYEIQKQVRIPPGFDIRYVVSVPEFLELDNPVRGAVQLVEFHGDNFEGSAARPLDLAIRIRLRPDTVPANVVDGPLVRAVFLVDDVTPLWKQLIPFAKGEYEGQLDLVIEVHSLDAALFASYPLPPSLRLDQISGDLLRIAIREGLVDRDDVTVFFEELIQRSLEEGFGEGVQVRMDWDELDQSLNQPVGGPDGLTVAPLVVHATALLPLNANKLFVASSVGRVVAMTAGTSGSFELTNDGMWRSDYTVAYPEGFRVRVRDSLGRTEHRDWGAREGFHVYLGQGETTKVEVFGRSDFEPTSFAAGVLEALVLAVGIWAAYRHFQGRRRPRPI